jgi:hypothetical protein
VRLRIGLHTGEPAVGDEGYTGLDVVRASRLAAIGRGGQVLLSDTTRAIVANDLPDGVGLRAMGERTLRDIERPEPLTELVIPGVEVSRAPDDAASRGTEPGPRRAGPPPPPLPPGVPDWVSSAIGQWMPGGDGARDLIERRVMSAIEDAFAEKSSRRSSRRSRVAGEGRDTGSRSGLAMSDEIDRLRGLHDAGALTEEQFRRAVDRVVGIDAAEDGSG